jgi:hypothetical protein
MLRRGYLHSQNNTVTQGGHYFLEFLLDLVDQLGLSAEAYFIRGFTLARAATALA